ncbi:DNA polymerase III subunit delta [Bombilactobacillus bombi]|uniref:DNA polymerase III subunit delta n=1 Tax=Bombilactobacillus bombi TaxID=1303590 RepID=UPI0015E5E720|nr:DNA polymerase III subunit delta [Bombilactobacillus bombi]
MKVKDLKTELKKGISPLYLVLGTESQLQKQARQEFLQILTGQESEMNFAEFDLDQDNVEEAVGEANSMPFFGERRVVFILNPNFLQGSKTSASNEQNLSAFMNYLQHPQPTTAMVIFAPYEKLDNRKKITKLLQKQAILVAATKLRGNEVTLALKQQITAAGFQIEPLALESLIQHSNGDYSLAISELQKLYTYAALNHQITKEAIEYLVPQTLDDNVFDMLDALLKRDLKHAQILYQQLILLKNDPIALVALAVSQIRLLLQVKILRQEGMSAGKLAGYLQVHPYRIKLALHKEAKYSLTKLQQALCSLVEIDFRMKTGQGNKEYLFELFMIDFTQNMQLL